jgi:hypothetical protein
MWLKWSAWRFVIRRLARSHGFLDPIRLWGRLSNFSQPSEVWAPFELLRAGAVFHARGLINSRAIQHNLDWIWPYWVERQFDPLGKSFIPRAFSLTHVNLTHRNWTALGIPGCEEFPLVDPRGLVTPFFDGWSVDCWVFPGEGPCLIPSRCESVSQSLDIHAAPAVTTVLKMGETALESSTEVVMRSGIPVCRIRYDGYSRTGGHLGVSIRPYNPEGVSLVHEIATAPGGSGWMINGKKRVDILPHPDCLRYSCYREGDVHHQIRSRGNRSGITCDVGMATTAALFAIEPGIRRQIVLEIPLRGKKPHTRFRDTAAALWGESLRECTALRIPDKKMQFLYEAALRTVVLHSPGEVYAGPYTYKRFWFRDASLIVHAMLCAGLVKRAERILDRFPARQTAGGYFLSQEGEWDSNGQALWIMGRYCELTGKKPPDSWRNAIRKAGDWIERKRISREAGSLHHGLLPPGFSAEHLGPNDYYFWDDFWGVAGLQAAASLHELCGERKDARRWRDAAHDFLGCIEKSLGKIARRLGRPAMPASPYRRLDSGAIGSLAAGYPLRLWGERDERILDTAEYLAGSCLIHGAFYHDIIHSGINPYLTLHIAQVLLRAGDRRYFSLMRALADLASPTGQWPEAIHPGTLGGCMGDGQHVWAAAEWLMILRNCFLREETPDHLILCSGIPGDWRQRGETLSFGPAPTPFGPLTVTLESDGTEAAVSWDAEWRGAEPKLEVRLPGCAPSYPGPGVTSVIIKETG